MIDFTASTLRASPAKLPARIVAEARLNRRRLPGFGHRFHDPDPRAQRLLALADEWGLSGRHVALTRSIVRELKATTDRSLPMNVDGALAALISDLGIDWRYGKTLFIIGRTAGLATHGHEEMRTGKPFKFAARVETAYVGSPERSLATAR